MAKRQSRSTKNIVTESDRVILRDRYEFIPSEHEDTSWEGRMVQRYHGGLHRDFAIADLSRPGHLGLRWRTTTEVTRGRGERSCGNKGCSITDGLITSEVPFSYEERGLHKRTLVKLRLCQECGTCLVPQTSADRNKKRRHHRQQDNGDDSASIQAASDRSNSKERRGRKARKIPK